MVWPAAKALSDGFGGPPSGAANWLWNGSLMFVASETHPRD